jgi:cytochrome d ubiquinol oxidase subunit I
MAAVGAIATSFFGDRMGKLLEEQQPMKMAAAEALYKTEQPAGLSLFAVADFKKNPERNNFNVTIPHGLSLLSGGWNTRVRGINEVQKEYEQRYGPGDYVPVVGVTYWAFRWMVGSAAAIVAITLVGLLLLWRRRLESTRWFQRTAIAAIVLPYIANSAGWIFTEMGRQPWSVQGLLLTKNAVSPGTTSSEVLTSLIGFAVMYAVLGLVMAKLFVGLARKGPVDPPETAFAGEADFSLTY